MSALPLEQGTPGAHDSGGAAPAPSAERRERASVWLQFPRRIVLLLVAFCGALLLIRALRAPLLVAGVPVDMGSEPDWSVSWLEKRPIVQMIGDRLPNTLTLVGAATLVASLLALVTTLVAVLVHKLEARAGPVGSLLKALGRLCVFGSAAMPVYGTAVVSILILTVQFKKWGLPSLPLGGMYTITPDNQFKYDLLDRLKHLILPSFVLALLPAVLTAQAVARELTLSREQSGFRLWIGGLLEGLGILLGQTGGLLSAAVLVEVIFAWPGIGRLSLDALYRRDMPVVLGILFACAIWILIGRLVAELFRWLAQLLCPDPTSPQPEPTRWRRTARTIWVVATLALLLIPLAIAAVGLTVDQDEVLQVDVPGGQALPSPDHPWGTDNLGRDVKARVLRGGLITLGTVALLAAAIVVPSGLGGALSGYLASRRALWSESLADLLLLPVDVLLFVPALLGAVLLTVMLGGGQAPAGSSALPVGSWVWASLACAPLLLPRAVRACQTLWVAASMRKRRFVWVLAGAGALLLAMTYAGFGLVTSLEFLGFGVRPPLPTLGGLTGESLRTLHGGGLGAVTVLWACSLSFYTAADALVGYFDNKDVLARLNE